MTWAKAWFSSNTTKTWSAAGMVLPLGLVGDGVGVGPIVLWLTPPQPNIIRENDNSKINAVLPPMGSALPSTALDAAELRDVVSSLKARRPRFLAQKTGPIKSRRCSDVRTCYWK